MEHDAVLETLQELEIGLVAYSPLRRGSLSGAIASPDDFAEGDWRRTDPRFQGDNFDRNLDVSAKSTASRPTRTSTRPSSRSGSEADQWRA
ncbi:hypothetical protein ACFT38_36550 [Streptomyces sp. NPDC056975]|uniref:hypothetical protein n=1 Tax=Streptomyces sp. NPDC056975 TaxID=3345985 RepID=UPI003634A5AF